MKNRRSGSLAAVCLSLILVALTGCSGSSSASSTAPAAPSTSSTTTSSAGKTEGTLKWPTSPINFIIPGSPGGGTDIPSRTICPFFEKELGVTFLPENMSTAGGSVCYNYVAKAAADGYTWGYVTVPAFAMSYVKGDLKADPRKDYEIIGQLVQSTVVICVGKNSPYKTFEELAEYAKANPDKLSYAGSGATSSDTLTAKALETSHNLKFRIVNYEGDNDIVVALMGGQVDIACINATVLPEYIKSGDIVPLAVLNVERSAKYPDLPTLKELGYEIPLNGTIQGIVLPAGTDPAIVEKVRSTFDKIVKDPEFLAAAEKANLSIEYHSAEEFSKKISDITDFLNSIDY